jgi:phosphoglycolate phosphatase-like HAD superfamily hydrolase
MLVLLWDIDGTLITTARAGIQAWEDALAEVAGARRDLGGFDTAGHPDHGIARRLLRDEAGIHEPARDLVQRLVTRYEDLLPEALARKTGRVLPNVREILEALAPEPGVRSFLLTGNTRRGASAKLTCYGLAEFFPNGGAFSDDGDDRDGIARAASALLKGRGMIARDTVVIGDTPHDVRCGRAIGATTLAVATGGYGAEALRSSGATIVVDTLPEPSGFLPLVRAGRQVEAEP